MYIRVYILGSTAADGVEWGRSGCGVSFHVYNSHHKSRVRARAHTHTFFSLSLLNKRRLHTGMDGRNVFPIKSQLFLRLPRVGYIAGCRGHRTGSCRWPITATNFPPSWEIRRSQNVVKADVVVHVFWRDSSTAVLGFKPISHVNRRNRSCKLGF